MALIVSSNGTITTNSNVAGAALRSCFSCFGPDQDLTIYVETLRPEEKALLKESLLKGGAVAYQEAHYLCIDINKENYPEKTEMEARKEILDTILG